VRSVLKIAVILASAGVLCGFDGQTLAYKLNAYRGQPIDAVMARFGEPAQREMIDGRPIYMWWAIYIDDRHYGCKIWAKLDKQNIVTSLGYQDCAF